MENNVKENENQILETLSNMKDEEVQSAIKEIMKGEVESYIIKGDSGEGETNAQVEESDSDDEGYDMDDDKDTKKKKKKLIKKKKEESDDEEDEEDEEEMSKGQEENIFDAAPIFKAFGEKVDQGQQIMKALADYTQKIAKSQAVILEGVYGKLTKLERENAELKKAFDELSNTPMGRKSIAGVKALDRFEKSQDTENQMVIRANNPAISKGEKSIIIKALESTLSPNTTVDNAENLEDAQLIKAISDYELGANPMPTKFLVKAQEILGSKVKIMA